MTNIHLPATDSEQPASAAPMRSPATTALPTVASTVSITVRIAPDQAFGVVAPVDLSRIFRGYGPLPAVVATDHQTGVWDTPGTTRTPRLSDGSTAHETLTTYTPPYYFAYSVTNFTNALRWLTPGARGEWWFTPTADGATLVRWRYTFAARSRLVFPVLWLVVRGLWQGYMRTVIRNTKQHAEAIAPGVR